RKCGHQLSVKFCAKHKYYFRFRGGYEKPSVKDTLFVQILTFPYYACTYCWWLCVWTYRFKLKGEEYGLEDKYYLIGKNLGMSEKQFSVKHEKQEFLDQELWIKDKFLKWKAIKDEMDKQKLSESAQYKRYRRYMKTHGQDQITFVE
ncbi:unnamed protein product, partial [Soboliphyme baturini]|uniref:Zf-TFIIB domain-containing protein n=1 Tax=Soboliphyme baturini TaxID=241478 RepID=A0A183J1T6_9BILA